MKYKIYLFRHGESTYNRDKKFTGWRDARLTPKGRRQAFTISKKLKNKKFEVAIQTSLSRSKETLNYVLKFHPECKKIIVDDRMIERSYGILEGTSHKSFIRNIGKKLLKLKDLGDAIENLSPRERRQVEKFFGGEEYEAIHRGYSISVPKGESFRDVEKRVGKFIEWLKKYMKKNKVNVAISAHGNSIRLFRKIMEKASREETAKWFVPYDRYFEYEV